MQEGKGIKAKGCSSSTPQALFSQRQIQRGCSGMIAPLSNDVAGVAAWDIFFKS